VAVLVLMPLAELGVQTKLIDNPMAVVTAVQKEKMAIHISD
jgi:hypothetical protein